EAAVQPRGESLAVEDHGADERGGAITLLVKYLRQRGVLRRKRYGKVGDAVRARQESGEDCGVRRIGNGTRSECLGEPHSALCQCVQRWRFYVLIAIAVNVVGPKGVDGNKENV